MSITVNKKGVNLKFIRIDDCKNGKQQYLFHYSIFKHINEDKNFTYSDALKIAKDFGGKIYNNSKINEYILFNTFDTDDLDCIISEILVFKGEAVWYEDHNYREKAFYIDDVKNKKGIIKKWFKTLENSEIKIYKLLY